jgi:hypothetical protein
MNACAEGEFLARFERSINIARQGAVFVKAGAGILLVFDLSKAAVSEFDAGGFKSATCGLIGSEMG